MIATSLRVVLSLWLLDLVSTWSQAADDLPAFTNKLIQQYEQLKDAGEDAAGEKLLKEGAARLQQHLDRQPDDSQMRARLMCIQALLQEYPAALGNIDILIAERPDVAVLHYAKARVLLADGRFDDAERSIRRSIKLEPKEAPSILVEYAKCLNAADRPEKAVAIAREAMQLDPLSDEPLLLMDAIAFNSENFGDWEKGLRAAIVKHPESHRLHQALINGLLKLQKLDKAYQEFLVVEKTDPDNANCVQWLIQLAPHLTFPMNPQPHVDRLYELHRAGKWQKPFFRREVFDVGHEEVNAWEYFEPTDTKLIFRLDDTRCEVILRKYQEDNQFLRLAELSPLNDVAYVLYMKRDYKLEPYREFKELPTYQETRTLALEIIKGKPEAK
jgi:tetratricopeptide (TPR) repeat protein